jgi:hypothetical protein
MHVRDYCLVSTRRKGYKMDTTSIIIYVLVALVVVAILLVFRRRITMVFKGPLGTQFDVQASNESSTSAPAILGRNIESREGSFVAQDDTGRGIDLDGVGALGDVKLSSASPPTVSNPKDGPPA